MGIRVPNSSAVMGIKWVNTNTQGFRKGQAYNKVLGECYFSQLEIQVCCYKLNVFNYKKNKNITYILIFFINPENVNIVVDSLKSFLILNLHRDKGCISI